MLMSQVQVPVPPPDANPPGASRAGFLLGIFHASFDCFSFFTAFEEFIDDRKM
jgi:hypothetical protein